jgi:outer membrane protein W
VLFAFLAVGAFAALPVRADDVDVAVHTDADTDHHDDDDFSHFKIYGGPAYVAPMGDGPISLDTLEDNMEAQSHVGWNLGFEWHFIRLLGVEVDYVNANQDVDFGGVTIGDTDFSPLTATLNFHLVATEHFDFYLGPSYSWVNWGDVELNEEGEGLLSTNGLAADSDTAWGVGLGFDAGWEHFKFTAGARYINTSLVLPGEGEVEVNPIVVRLGVAFTF